MLRQWIRTVFGCMLLLIASGSLAQNNDPITLTVYWMWSPSNPQALSDLLNEFVTDYQAENPDVLVDLQLIDWSVGRETILEAVEAGTPPDLAVIGARWVPEFVSEGIVEPLDRYMTRDFRRRFVPSIINEGAIYQGRVFGLPVATSTRALFYNQALFDQAGIDAPPATWDELRDTALAVADLPGDFYGFGLQGGGEVETNTYYYYFMWGNGGDLFDDTRTLSALDNAPAIDALTYLQQLIADGGTQPNPTDAAYARRRGVEDLFQQGQLAMVISGPWFINRLRTEAPDLEFGVAPLPYNTTPATYGVMDAITILSTSRQKEQAWDFLQFIYTDARRLAYTQTAGVLPELTSVTQDPAFADDPQYATFLALLPDARFEPLHIQSEAIAQRVIEAVRAVYLGEALPQEALQSAAEDINELLEVSVAGW